MNDDYYFRLINVLDLFKNNVNIFGKIKYRDYENKEGNKVYITEITASEIKPITWKNKDGSGADSKSNNDLTF